ncbi:MAG TPA: helix-turn-helix transcriptional regulator [Pirellulales bacterium]|jgi:transcriptional regulator with XRE-family HTH domain|nr:helix-turn-helix transcriptional regulator [Pirellulales bacterium]
MAHATTIEIHGEEFVILPRAEYEKLLTGIANRGDATGYPPLPPADAAGNRPARETLQVVLARKLIERRQKLGLTQQQLSELADVRAETISRLESGKHAPNAATVDKLEDAMDKFSATAPVRRAAEVERKRTARATSPRKSATDSKRQLKPPRNH